MLNLVAYKESSGISGVKNTCISYTSSPTWWGFRILCGFSPLKWSAVQFVLFCYRVTKISVNLSIHYFGSYFHTPSKSTNHSKTHSSCKHESQKIQADNLTIQNPASPKLPWNGIAEGHKDNTVSDDSEFSNASDTVTMQVLSLWKLQVLPLAQKDSETHTESLHKMIWIFRNWSYQYLNTRLHSVTFHHHRNRKWPYVRLHRLAVSTELWHSALGS
jgi:hypothetical protein